MKKRVGEKSEESVLRTIKALRRNKKKLATQREITKRCGLDTRVVRQILRRLRRQKRVEVVLQEHDLGKRKMRVYR